MPVRLQDFHGMPALVLERPDGARAVVLLHGGHVVSWRAAGAPQEQLYLSPASLFADDKAVRGGVPVIFPQFADRGPFVRHGFARTRRWQRLPGSAGVDAADPQLRLRLCDDAATRALWPHAFTLDLTVRLGRDTLGIDLVCTNTGSAAWTFTAALHTYLAVRDVAQLQLHGLSGLVCDDRVSGANRVQDESPLRISGEVDRVYADVPGPLQLEAPEPAGLRRREIAQQGFTDVVVWNPGAARCAALPDMPADGYHHMLCVEAACINRPVTLAGGQSWTGTQTLRAAG
ncbi:MAG: D-hexose-6-phosphate mutarotase [Rhodoferax sp.]|nr:D-hexose-6-phosphate mutarotase [Rhodoferax sp.]